MEKQRAETILEMLKAVADESRLALLRQLSQGERTVGDLAQQVQLGEPTVSHHLTRMRKAGLVTLRTAGNQRFYRLHEEGLARFKRLVDGIEKFETPAAQAAVDEAWIEMLGWNASDAQVLREHIVGGQLTHLPAKQKKMLIILRWLATLFKPDQRYSEAEINEVLKHAYAEDYVSLRRDLVDMGFLRRERGGGKYWLAPAE